jgi:hypothetical protein
MRAADYECPARLVRAFVITDELIEYGIAESELVFHR